MKLKKPCQLSKNEPDEMIKGPISISIIHTTAYNWFELTLVTRA